VVGRVFYKYMEMKKLIIIVVFFSLVIEVSAQKYLTKNGHIKFYSETPVETIEAHNRQINSALDISTGDFVFKVLIKSFEFEKALMQEHFNENYMESEKFPNAMFKGKITNLTEIDFLKDGDYETMVEGELTIHGVTNKINEIGTFEISGEEIHGNSIFQISPADYKIKIPNTVIGNIAESIDVTVNIKLEKIKN